MSIVAKLITIAAIADNENIALKADDGKDVIDNKGYSFSECKEEDHIEFNKENYNCLMTESRMKFDPIMDARGDQCLIDQNNKKPNVAIELAKEYKASCLLAAQANQKMRLHYCEYKKEILKQKMQCKNNSHEGKNKKNGKKLGYRRK